MFMDTDLEKEIGLGADYPYPALGAGECNVPSTYQASGKQIGDKVTVEFRIGKMLRTMAAIYNEEYDPKIKAKSVASSTKVTFDCTIKNFITKSYGKYGEKEVTEQLIMEFDQMFPFLTPYLPETLRLNKEFVAYLEQPDTINTYASMLMMVLPGDRLSYYKESDVAQMRAKIYDVTNEIANTLGYYPTLSYTDLLRSMANYNVSILMIGLIFSIVLILFVIISILLIYSLLMITTETKTFDTGVMRLIGLSSKGFVAMILTQAVMFVVPSIIVAYICSFPVLAIIMHKIFKTDASYGISCVPTGIATLEAVGIGLLIPLLSAIIPIQRSLAKTLGESLNTARSSLSGTIVIIEGKGIKMIPYVLFGLLCVTFGVTIYIILP